MGTIGSVMEPFKTDWDYQWYNGTLSTQNGTISSIMGLPQGLKSAIHVYLHFTLQGCRRLDEALAVVVFQGDVSVPLGEALAVMFQISLYVRLGKASTVVFQVSVCDLARPQPWCFKSVCVTWQGLSCGVSRQCV